MLNMRNCAEHIFIPPEREYLKGERKVKKIFRSRIQRDLKGRGQNGATNEGQDQ